MPNLVRHAMVALALVALPGPAQAAPTHVKLGKYVYASHNRFKNETTTLILRQPLDIVGRVPRVYEFAMGVGYACPVTSRCEPDSVFITISYAGKEWRFLRSFERSVTFIVGEDRITVEMIGHDAKVEPGYRSAIVSETMLGYLRRADAIRILESAGEGKVGQIEFAFSKKAAPAMAEMALNLRSFDTSD